VGTNTGIDVTLHHHSSNGRPCSKLLRHCACNTPLVPVVFIRVPMAAVHDEPHRLAGRGHRTSRLLDMLRVEIGPTLASTQDDECVLVSS
jgi:pyrimidine deaminase RibD-like protein